MLPARMKSRWILAPRTLVITLSVGALMIAVLLWRHFREPSLAALADQVRTRVAAIRGREFERPTPVRQISPEQTREFLREQMAELPKIEHYWAVVRTLGLYRGPDRGAPEEMFEALYTLAAGFYDPQRKEMMVLWDLDQESREILLSHELCHALQDQHFDLERYFIGMARRADANADELLARQAVVEGEATLVDAIYQAHAAGIPQPTHELLKKVLADQSFSNPDLWETWLAHPDLDDRGREQMRAAIETRNRLPPFAFELFLAPYVDGARFVHAVQERGWKEVDRLYGPQPPVSTEQILHPEKWRVGEEYARISWPPFDERFADWKLLYENSLGERQWQAVFRAQGLPKLAEAAAAGWNGDRFAIFRRHERDDMLMLLFTVWDSPDEATEFAEAYRLLLAAKYPSGAVPLRLLHQGQVVGIVEGGDEDAVDAFAAFNASAQWYDSRP